MAEVETNIRDEMLEQIGRLAVKQYGDGSEASRERVIETALKMRILWSRSVRVGQQETDEAVTSWEFPESEANEENAGSIRNWLFRR
jgi:hypothetical protein